MLGGLAAVLAMNWLSDVLADRGVVAAVDPATERVIELTDPEFATSPLIAAVVAFVVIASPRVSRQWRRVLWFGVALLILFRVVSSSEPPLDIVIAVALGMAVGYLALLAFGTESADPDADELVSMLRPVADPVRIEQLAGDTPLRYLVDLADGEKLQLRVRTRHGPFVGTAGAGLAHGPAPDGAGRRAVRRRSSDASSTRHSPRPWPGRPGCACRPCGTSSPRPRARWACWRNASTAPRCRICLPTRLDRPLLRRIWQQVAALHRQRIAHRALGLGVVSVTATGDVAMSEFDAARLAASDRDLGLDRAQVLVDTALRVGADEAVAVAVETLGPKAVVAAVPYLQPLALPASTRRSLRGNREVLDALQEAVQKTPPASSLPRWPGSSACGPGRPCRSWRSQVASTSCCPSSPTWARPRRRRRGPTGGGWCRSSPGAAATFFAAALSLLGSVPQPIPYLATVRMQVASAFVGRIAPANTGTLAVGVRFLQRSGVDTAAAGTAVGLNALVGFIVHLSLMAAFVAWAGARGPGFSLPDANVWLLVIAIGGAVSGLIVGLVPALRRRVLPPLLGYLRTAGSSLADVVTDPLRVLALLGGALGITFAFILTLMAAVAGVRRRRQLPRDRRRLPHRRGDRVGDAHARRARGGGGGARGGPVGLRHGRQRRGVVGPHLPPGHLLGPHDPGMDHVPADAAQGGAVAEDSRNVRAGGRPAHVTGTISWRTTRPAASSRRPTVRLGWRRRWTAEPGLNKRWPSTPSTSTGSWLWPNTTSRASGNHRWTRRSRPARTPLSCTMAMRTPASSSSSRSGRAPTRAASLLPRTAWTGPAGPERVE